MYNMPVFTGRVGNLRSTDKTVAACTGTLNSWKGQSKGMLRHLMAMKNSMLSLQKTVYNREIMTVMIEFLNKVASLSEKFIKILD